MRWSGRTIWDTRIQDVCGILTASADGEIFLFASASFAQASFDPPRVIVNPNRTYGIDQAIRKSRRFAINVMPATSRELMIRLMQTRRRQAAKDRILGLTILEDSHGIPYLKGSLRSVFCEVEQQVDTGDRGLYIARVLESRENPELKGVLPLLFKEASDLSKYPNAKHVVRGAAVSLGVIDGLKVLRQRLRPSPPANIPQNTYEEAGATDEEMRQILELDPVDRGRRLNPPRAVIVPSGNTGVCVVGTGWGQNHAKYLKWANPNIRLFVCGRNVEKTDRIARVTNAEGAFYSLEEAVKDPRVNALTLALPHHLHKEAVVLAANAGKHVLVEKPISTNLADADEMISHARRAGIILMVAEDMHFRPAIRKSVELIEQGAIGEPLYLLAHAGGIRRPQGWANDQELMGGGVLIDIGIHYVRAIRLLMGEPETAYTTRAMQINTRMSGEDSAQVIFASKVGWQAHLLCSWSSYRGHLPDIVVTGDKGTLHLWPGARYVDYYPVAPKPVMQFVPLIRPRVLQGLFSKPVFQRSRIELSDSEGTGYLGEMQEFLACVAEEREPITSAEDGRRDLEIILACYAGLAKGVAQSIG